MSCKFVYHQKNMVSAALNEVFTSSAPDDEVLFELPVTKTWLCQLTLGVTLIGHGSYRGVVELMRDLLGVHISEDTVLTSVNRRRDRLAPSAEALICRQFGSACTTKSFRVPSPFSPLSTPGRPAAIGCSSGKSLR